MASRSFRKYLRGLRDKGGLIFIPVALFAFTAPASAEELSPGLSYATFASGGGSPPLPTESNEPITTGTVAGINFDWGGGQILDSGRHDGVIVRFEGWILPPEPAMYYLCAFTDDGFELYLDGELVIPDWWDRGPQCGSTADVDFSSGQAKQLLAYYYENGGGAVAQLLYYTTEGIWDVVPDSWYSQSDPVPPTTTTTTTTTTIPESTTSFPEETVPEETLPEETVPEENLVEVPETTTTTQVPIIIPPAPPVVVPPTAETSVPPETTPPETTIPETTAPETTIPETTPPEPTNPDPEPSLAPQPETETTVNEPEQPATSIEEQPSEEPVSEPETDEETPQEESEPPLEEESEEGPSDLLEQALAEGSVSNLSADQITQAFYALTLESLSDEEISQLIKSINPEELTEEQAEALAAALSSAPDSVKAEFESQINVFNGTFDSYVPKGSTISVGQRRLIVAATCVVFAMPAPAVSRSRGV